MDIATLGLRVDGTGAIRTVDAFAASSSRAARAGAGAERTAQRLQGAFARLAATLGISFGVRELIRYADTWNLVEGRISLVTRSQREQIAVESELFAVAQRSRAEYEGIAGLYGKVARNAKGLNASQRDVLEFTETVSKGFIVSGASVSEMNNAIVQLGQGLASGRLQGDELRSILENAPRLAEAIARGMGVTVGQLRKLGSEGKLTAKEIFDAVRSQRAAIEEEFRRMPVTIGQAFTVFTNEIKKFIGGADDAAGASRTVGSAILFLAQNLGTLVKAVAFAALWWGTYTLAVKGMAAATAIAAGVQAVLARSQTASTVATGAQTVAIVDATGVTIGYEAVMGGAAVTTDLAAAGMTRAAGAAAVLSAAGRGLVAVLTGPAGIALALTAVIALLVSYKSANEQAAESNRQLASSLSNQTDAQLQAEAARVRGQMQGTQAEMARLRAQGQQFEQRRVSIPVPGSVVPITRTITAETDAYKAQRLELEKLQAQLAVVGRVMEDRKLLTQSPSGGTPATPLTDAVKDQILANRLMVEAARQEVRLAGEQGMAQERLRIQFEATTKEMEARANTEISSVLPATLAAIRAERDLRLEALDVSAIREQTQAREDAARTHQQTVSLLGAEAIAQTRLRIEYDAANRAIEAQRNLTGRALENTLQDINVERERRMLEERLRIIRSYREGVREEFRNLFEDIWNNGIQAFGNLFDTVRRMMGRLVADLASKQFMRVIGDTIGGKLAQAFGGLDKLSGNERAATALTGSATALTGAATALQAAASRLGAPPIGGGTPGVGGLITPPPVQRRPGDLQELVVTAPARKRAEEAGQAMAKTFAKYAGPALAGFFAGQAVGGMTTNRGLGALGGAASGAATGALMGGPVGAVIGGITGAIGGFIGASNKRAEQERMMREVLNRNNERIRELNENIQGLALMAGQNLGKASGAVDVLAKGRTYGGFFGGFAAGAFGGVGSKELAEALKGGESSKRLKQLEAQFGITMQEVGRMARQMGIELFDSAGKLIPSALKQLNEAIQLEIRARTQFTASLDDQKRRQEAYNRLFDVPQTPLNQLNDAYALLSKGAPDLLKQMGLANLDLSSEAARKVLLSGMQDIFKLIDAGLLTPELLGAFTDKNALIDALLAAKEGLDAFKNSLGNVTTDFPKAMDLILYEQRYGKGTGSVPSTPREPMAPPKPKDTGPSAPTGERTGGRPIIFNVNLYNEAGDTADVLADKLEQATQIVQKRGGFTVLSGATS